MATKLLLHSPHVETFDSLQQHYFLVI